MKSDPASSGRAMPKLNPVISLYIWKEIPVFGSTYAEDVWRKPQRQPPEKKEQFVS
jgi:hypothetical protein